MEAEKYIGPAERERTLLERIEALEAHHEETRKRMHQQQEQLNNQRNRIDRILGSEPEIVSAPDSRDYNRSGR